ncbi:putative transmembrane protein [Legionella donaldsonii]|uniref:Putative transmembrane protein n=1 Tax=Legionella donaldsonii TaxID=45060 RepID=A0A378J8R9_9GAMM|nr:MlaD family protein [Legionella donaldsonii]STX44224.1 putative transmembrane protein [Legionella donaldsonii]
MQQDRVYTLVGFLGAGALCLLLLGSVFFYTEHKRAQAQTFVMFFNGSLKGLVINSPVTYLGVKIGEVNFIELTEDKKRNKVRIPIYVRFFVNRNYSFSQDPVHLLINDGYVANIGKPNLLTGVAEIELIPSDSSRQFKQTYYQDYPIFPTYNKVEPYTSMEEVFEAAKKTFEDISELVRSKEIKTTLESLQKMSDSLDILVSSLNQNVPGVVTSLNQSLKQITAAAYSTQNLTDYLSRYPESLLRGKQ